MVADSRRMRESPLTAILSMCSLMLAILASLFDENDSSTSKTTRSIRLSLLLYSTNRVIVGQALLADACTVNVRNSPDTAQSKLAVRQISGPLMEPKTFASCCRGCSREQHRIAMVVLGILCIVDGSMMRVSCWAGHHQGL
jgi:hypothetical protein